MLAVRHDVCVPRRPAKAHSDGARATAPAQVRCMRKPLQDKSTPEQALAGVTPGSAHSRQLIALQLVLTERTGAALSCDGIRHVVVAPALQSMGGAVVSFSFCSTTFFFLILDLRNCWPLVTVGVFVSAVPRWQRALVDVVDL